MGEIRVHVTVKPRFGFRTTFYAWGIAQALGAPRAVRDGLWSLLQSRLSTTVSALALVLLPLSACAKPVRTLYTPPYQVEPAAAVPSRWCEGSDDTCCWRCVKKPEYRVGCDVAGLVPCPEGSR